MLPLAAVMVTLAVPVELARPFEPAALLIETALKLLVQVTELVRFCVELSENIPVAVNCSLVPALMLGLAGVTEIDTRLADVTVSDTWAEVIDPNVAAMLVLPTPAELASP